MRWSVADEGRHDDALGVESWGFEGSPGGVPSRIRLTFDAAHGRAGYVADFDLPTGRVIVADESVPLPRRAAGLDIRADGLWASLCCETPFEHWSLGLEAFGLRLDESPGADATTAAGSWDELVGERIPVGFDLEWELRGPPEPLADGAGYAQPGVVIGDLLVGRTRIPVQGATVRDHWWGAPRPAIGRSGVRTRGWG